MNRVYLSLGSNLGDKPVNLLSAISLITKEIGVISSVSSVYETKPCGYRSDNVFFNIMVCVETGLPPFEILTLTQNIEKTIGRKQKTNHIYSDRVIDIDLIMYENLIIQSEELTLPHPLFHQRRFVLEPFNEIAPDCVHPVLKKKVKDLFAELS